jgi:hypothetical protein
VPDLVGQGNRLGFALRGRNPCTLHRRPRSKRNIFANPAGSIKRKYLGPTFEEQFKKGAATYYDSTSSTSTPRCRHCDASSSHTPMPRP